MEQLNFLQIIAQTIHTADGSPDRQITIDSFEDDTIQAEHLLRDLHPGSTFNISLQPKGRIVEPAWGKNALVSLEVCICTSLKYLSLGKTC